MPTFELHFEAHHHSNNDPSSDPEQPGAMGNLHGHPALRPVFGSLEVLAPSTVSSSALLQSVELHEGFVRVARNRNDFLPVPSKAPFLIARYATMVHARFDKLRTCRMGVTGLTDVFNTDGTLSLAACQCNADFEQHRRLHQLAIEAKQRADESEESNWAERREREKAEKRQRRRLGPLGLGQWSHKVVLHDLSSGLPGASRYFWSEIAGSWSVEREIADGQLRNKTALPPVGLLSALRWVDPSDTQKYLHDRGIHSAKATSVQVVWGVLADVIGTSEDRRDFETAAATVDELHSALRDEAAAERAATRDASLREIESELRAIESETAALRHALEVAQCNVAILAEAIQVRLARRGGLCCRPISF